MHFHTLCSLIKIAMLFLTLGYTRICSKLQFTSFLLLSFFLFYLLRLIKYYRIWKYLALTKVYTRKIKYAWGIWKRRFLKMRFKALLSRFSCNVLCKIYRAVCMWSSFNKFRFKFRKMLRRILVFYIVLEMFSDLTTPNAPTPKKEIATNFDKLFYQWWTKINCNGYIVSIVKSFLEYLVTVKNKRYVFFSLKPDERPGLDEITQFPSYLV